jgi:hypothetical protein
MVQISIQIRAWIEVIRRWISIGWLVRRGRCSCRTVPIRAAYREARHAGDRNPSKTNVVLLEQDEKQNRPGFIVPDWPKAGRGTATIPV